jgi:hypothetical protein
MQSEFFHLPTLPSSKQSKERKTLPKRIGPYEVESFLSHGGMSALYLAKKAHSSQLYVVKVLPEDFLNDDDLKERFLKEAEIIALTDHPNIVKLYGQGQWDGGLYIAMEFIQGISLKQFIVQQSLSYQRSLEILLEVSYALLHLHSHGVIHRDLKPENILMTESGHIKVIDFGVALLVSGKLNEKNKTVGTPSYMSPEQKKNPLKAVFASDIYSLGIIAFELITGKLSFGHVQLGLLPQEIKPVIQKALAHSLDERYEDIVDLITDLARIIKAHANEKGKGQLQSTLPTDITQALESMKTVFFDFSHIQSSGLEYGLVSQDSEEISLTLFLSYRLTTGNFLIITGNTPNRQFQGIFLQSYLKGVLEHALKPYETAINQPFELTHFVDTLNLFLRQKQIISYFELSFIFLNLDQDQFQFLALGNKTLWQANQARNGIRKIASHNPLLPFIENISLSTYSENFFPGDLLIFFDHFPVLMHEHEIEKILSEIKILSPQLQAESLMNLIENLELDDTYKGNFVFVIKRIE